MNIISKIARQQQELYKSGNNININNYNKPDKPTHRHNGAERYYPAFDRFS